MKPKIREMIVVNAEICSVRNRTVVRKPLLK